MPSYKNEQRHVLHRGRDFHFVSYEGRVANERRAEAAEPAMWYVMAAGKRQAVMPQVAGQESEELERELVRWLDENVFAGVPAPRRAVRSG